jgi:hypothetical protein
MTILSCMQAEIREKLFAMYQAHSLDCVSVFGFRTQVRSLLTYVSLHPCPVCCLFTAAAAMSLHRTRGSAHGLERAVDTVYS